MNSKLELYRFFVQVSLSTCLFLVCGWKLIDGSTPIEEKTLYFGGISTLLAWWMPSPGNNTTNHIKGDSNE